MVVEQLVSHSLKNISTKEIIEDFRLSCVSREMSILARREVLTGKAKFGIGGGGKEVPQVVLARYIKEGDFTSCYYRDQTLMLALGKLTIEEYFAQLYADTKNESHSGGRQMNGHYATPYVDKQGDWIEQKSTVNISAQVSCTAGQMAHAVGLALASKLYRTNKDLHNTAFSDQGNEICFATIGDASTSEGAFWESINAVGVMQVPLATFVWDDGYGISVPIKYQTTKESISAVLEGFQSDKAGEGVDIYKIKGWDYASLIKTFEPAIAKIREHHTPALFHVNELMQPQGHSTSGSHERYKSAERLQWEAEIDCIRQMRLWMVSKGIVTEAEINEIMKEAKMTVKKAANKAWKDFINPIKADVKMVLNIYRQLLPKTSHGSTINECALGLEQLINPSRREIITNVKRALRTLKTEGTEEQKMLENWLKIIFANAHESYNSKLYNESVHAALNVTEVPKVYANKPTIKNGFEVLNAFFDKMLEAYPNTVAFGEDVGFIGDVNQGFAGLQKKYGEHRVFDTGIREWTIMGQGIGLAMRGFRPIAEIQYLDYLLYGLAPLSDDLATLHYRTNGQQIAPAIIRTRGHRLEGIWHSGSPMGLLLGSLRGIYIITPRDMVQAAGFYNTMLQSNDPALIIECLNGYRLKEEVPSNLGEYTIPLGVPEVLKTGTDVTLVTYGSCVRVAQEGMLQLEKEGISVELIDVQTLLPFDINHSIVESLEKTNRIVFLDEDAPGGASAYMMQEVLEKQNGYFHLDSKPLTITAKAHRPAYGSDGDYFSKPNAEDVFESIYKLMYESNPQRFDKLYFI